MTSPPTIGLTFPGGPTPADVLSLGPTVAPELVDLASLFSDLLIADMAAHHIKAPEIQGTEFLYLRRACWEGALIAYGRCFGTGQGATGEPRRRLDDFLTQLPDRLQSSHHRILLLRNKRIGHHVALDSGQRVVLSAGIAHRSSSELRLRDVFVGVETELYDTALLDDLAEITTSLRGWVGSRIDHLRRALLVDLHRDPNGVRSALDPRGTTWGPPQR